MVDVELASSKHSNFKTHAGKTGPTCAPSSNTCDQAYSAAARQTNQLKSNHAGKNQLTGLAVLCLLT
jgi:hypothetical protein